MQQQQQPHLDILSHNRVNRSTIIVAVIPVTLFSGVLIYALWSFLWLLAYGAMVLLSISALYLVAILVIDVYRRWLQAPYLYVDEQNGVFDTSAGRMYPLALPAPIITEEKEEDEEMQRAKVLLCYDTGMHLREIEKTTGVKYWKVQKWTSEYDAKKANR